MGDEKFSVKDGFCDCADGFGDFKGGFCDCADGFGDSKDDFDSKGGFCDSNDNFCDFSICNAGEKLSFLQ